MEAVGINYAEVLSRKGMYGWAPDLPYVLGMEATGRIDSVGDGVERRPGEAVVVGMQHGAYAERLVVDESKAWPAVEGFSVEENAAFGVNYTTAWVSLVELGRLRAGDRVLISPAGGGVGTAAVQIAHHFGCYVVGAAGADPKLDRIRELGADETVNYRRPGWQKALEDAAGAEGIDIAFDMVGAEVFAAAKSVLAPFGHVVVAGYAALDYSLWNPLSWWRAWQGKPRMSRTRTPGGVLGPSRLPAPQLPVDADHLGRADGLLRGAWYPASGGPRLRFRRGGPGPSSHRVPGELREGGAAGLRRVTSIPWRCGSYIF